MTTTRKIRQTDGAPARVSSRAGARFGLGVMALAAATTLSVTGLAVSAAQAGTIGQQGPAPIKTVILIGPGPVSPGPTPIPLPSPVPSPTAPETGCCA